MIMTEDSVHIYRKIAQIPELNNAKFIFDERRNGSEFCIEVTWLNRDLLKMEKMKSHENLFMCSGNVISSPASPQPSDVILRRISPSGRKVAAVYQNTDEMYIHISEPEGHQHCINLKELDAHGMVYSDPYMSSLEWSTDEEYLLYTAEEWRPEACGYYDSKFNKKGSNSDLGSKFLHRDDWGEQLKGQHKGVVVKLNIYNKNIIAISAGDDLAVGEAIFVPFTHDIVGVATVCQPVRLGVAYSSDREAVILHIDESSLKVTELTPRGLHSERPRFSPDGKKLMYLQSAMFGPVVTTAQIWLLEWPSKKNRLLLDYVADKMAVPGSPDFRGICSKGVVPSRCWDSTSSKIYFSVLNKNTYMLCEMDVESKQVLVFPSEKSHIVLDVKCDKLLVKLSSATAPDCLLLGNISIKEQFEPCFRSLTTEKSIPDIPKHWYDIWEFPVTENDTDGPKISAMYIGPTCNISGEGKRPLILWPHGGPHAIRINAFNHWYAFMIAMGYSILLPNYRGSSGMGQNIMTSSVGRCGIDDLDDCKRTLDVCLKRFPDVLDDSQIYGIGLSHGGCLSCHLVIKYPNLMRAVCLMNPSLDIHEMATASDIPEWAFLEYGMPYKIGRAMDQEAAIRFFERSPVSYVDKIKTPTLLMMGSDDYRCPGSMSLNLHRLLLARNIPTRMYIYPDNHPLASLQAESDAVIQITRWFDEHKK